MDDESGRPRSRGHAAQSADPHFPTLSVQPLHRTMQDEIRHYIARAGLRPGDRLIPEAELARLFGVSRNSIREAVKALESTGVVETRRGSGVFVREFSWEPLLENLPHGLMQSADQALAELVQLRKVLETTLIGEVMATLTDDTVAALRDVLDEARERSERGERFPEQDRAFHRLLFTDLGNSMLLQLFDLFWVAFDRAAPATPDDDEPTAVYQRHADVLDAVLSGDVARAREAIRAHYEGIDGRVAASMARQAELSKRPSPGPARAT